MKERITAKDVWEHKPCEPWTLKKLEKLAGKNGKTLLEILDMEK